MLTAIIFSLDRAMQLDATLCSFFKHCQDPELVSLNVLYRTSNSQREKQYTQLQQRYAHVKFIREGNFFYDLQNILTALYDNDLHRSIYRFFAGANFVSFKEGTFLKRVMNKLISLGVRIGPPPIPVPKRESYLFFMVDDNIFIKPFHLLDIVRALQKNETALGFSLRLGMNTTYAYMHDCSQALPDFSELSEDGILMYDWVKSEHDFNYPLEVSSSIYRIQQVLPLLVSFRYHNPNDLEGSMAARSAWYRIKFPKLLCYKSSVAFCNPINKVQTILAENKSAQVYHYDITELEEKFADGWRIDVEALQDFVPNACHHEVDLKFYKPYDES